MKLRRAAALTVLPLTATSLGFTWFLHMTAARPALPHHADGIVVLTGGPDRIEAGLRLLADDRAAQLLISGVGRGPEFSGLAHRAGLDPDPLAGRVTLGRFATSTRTNAEETAYWAHDKNIHSLIVVTAAYHMPRAMVELRRALPDIDLYPAPVPPQHDTTFAPSWRRLAGEYVKWVLAQLGLSRYGRVRPPSTGAAISTPNGLAP
ncbi:MAG: YdcF family protein [Acetobacteraceae bacterium]|nr:YdcF family protein [Acetobacteraceae bacterium]